MSNSLLMIVIALHTLLFCARSAQTPEPDCTPEAWPHAQYAPITRDTLARLEPVVSFACDTPVELVWSPDGTYLAISTTEGIWVHDLKEPDVHPHRFPPVVVNPWDGIGSVAFNSDSTVLATVNPPDGDLHLWSLIDEKHSIVQIQSQGYTGTAAISPDLSRWAIARNDGAVSVWDVETENRVMLLEGHHRRVGALTFSPDGSRLVSAGGRVGAASMNPQDTTLRVWNTISGDLLATIELGGLVNISTDPAQPLTFSPDGNSVAFTVMYDNRDPVLWIVDIDQLTHTTSAFEDRYVKEVAFSPDGSTLAVGSRSHLRDLRGVVFLDAERHTTLATLPVEGMVLSTVVSPDGLFLAVAYYDTPADRVEIWAVVE
jgi:WD40 repeat protein